MIENKIIENDGEIVELLNNYFSSVFTEDREKVPFLDKTHKVPKEFDSVAFT